MIKIKYTNLYKFLKLIFFMEKQEKNISEKKDKKERVKVRIGKGSCAICD